MRHGRSDYDRRIQDIAGKIPQDEPVFLIRARDPAAVESVRDYARRVKAMGGEERVVQRAADQADAMEIYARDHPTRMPD
jgi:hypothetical protein